MAEIEIVTDAEFLAARTRDCAEIGLTWDKLMATRRRCGCCFDGPNAERRRMIWFVYGH